MYQTYQPSKYGLSGSPGYDSYMNRDFRDLSMEDTVNPVNLDDPLNPSTYTPSSYDLKKFDDELFGRTGKNNYYDGSTGNSNELDLDTPHAVADTWISPPLRQTPNSDLPPDVYTTPVRSTKPGVLRETLKYNEEKAKLNDIAMPPSDSHVPNSNHHSQWKDRNNVEPHHKHGSGPADLGQWQKQHQNHMVFRQTEAQVRLIIAVWYTESEIVDRLKLQYELCVCMKENLSLFENFKSM